MSLISENSKAVMRNSGLLYLSSFERRCIKGISQQVLCAIFLHSLSVVATTYACLYLAIRTIVGCALPLRFINKRGKEFYIRNLQFLTIVVANWIQDSCGVFALKLVS